MSNRRTVTERTGEGAARSYGERLREHRISLSALALALFASLILVGCSNTGGGSGGRIAIATGGTGGIFQVYGSGIAEQINGNLEGYQATAEATQASADNMFLINDGSADLAFALSDTAVNAARGEGEFDQPIPIRAIANLYSNQVHLVTLEGSGIESVEDLEGRRVSVGSTGGGTELVATRILEAAGINPEEGIDRRQLAVEESVNGLRDGAIDAFFYGGGVPAAGISDLSRTNEIRLLPTGEYFDDLSSEYGEGYEEGSILADSYEGVSEDVPTIGIPTLLVASEDMDEELAYQVTELLFDNKEDLVQVHPEAENLDPERAQDVPEDIELHPGAQRYYEEASGQ